MMKWTVCGQWYNNIIYQIKASGETEEDEEISKLPPNVISKQALSPVDTLKRYVEHLWNMSDDIFNAIVHLESVLDKIPYSSLKQTIIESFIK